MQALCGQAPRWLKGTLSMVSSANPAKSRGFFNETNKRNWADLCLPDDWGVPGDPSGRPGWANSRLCSIAPAKAQLTRKGVGESQALAWRT